LPCRCSTDASGKRSSNAFDVAGRMTSSTDASGRTTKYEYDANGNRTKTTLADLREIKYTYDALNRLTETQYADGSKHTISGNAVETYEAGNFGEPNNSAPEFGHQYTGEQWDGDGQFVYLRGRGGMHQRQVGC
jgi:YD repeat-containing protein